MPSPFLDFPFFVLREKSEKGWWIGRYLSTYEITGVSVILKVAVKKANPCDSVTTV